MSELSPTQELSLMVYMLSALIGFTFFLWDYATYYEKFNILRGIKISFTVLFSTFALINLLIFSGIFPDFWLYIFPELRP